MSWMCNIPKDDSTCDSLKALHYTAFKTRVVCLEKPVVDEGITSIDELTAIRAAHVKEIDALNKATAMQKAIMARDLHDAHKSRDEAIQRVDDLEREMKKMSIAYTVSAVDKTQDLAHAQLASENAVKQCLVLTREVETLKSALQSQKARSASEQQAAKASTEAALRRALSLDSQLHDVQQENTRLSGELEEAYATSRVHMTRLQEAQTVCAKLEADLLAERELIALNAKLFEDLGREREARKQLHNELEDIKGRIRVYVRIRPLSELELERKCVEAVTKDGKMSVLVRGGGYPDMSNKNYDFDEVFGGVDGNSQEDVFREAKHLMLSVIDGYNVCICAYGQTGSGKTYTMMGGTDIGQCQLSDGSFEPSAGVAPRAVAELFRLLEERSSQSYHRVEVQMFQLYKDKVEDLLWNAAGRRRRGKERETDSPPALRIVLADHSSSGLVEVEGAERVVCETAADVLRVVAAGSSRRTTASTHMNAESSRSHLICVLVVRLENRRTKAVTLGKLTLVDLAGSEKVDKSGAAGEVLKQAQSINKSLSALGGVIGACSGGSNHIPYRDHPLTMLMSDSIGGNAKTLMFVNCSPADYNNVESNNSLTFAARCKDITNAVSGLQGGDLNAQLVSLKREVSRMRRNSSGATPTSVSSFKPPFDLQFSCRDDYVTY